jgi:hypothetical protein
MPRVIEEPVAFPDIDLAKVQAALDRPILPSAEELNFMYPTFLTRFENGKLELGFEGRDLETMEDPLAMLFDNGMAAEEERPRKYKTEMCKYFLLGCCKRRKECTFAHVVDELRPVESRMNGSKDHSWSEVEEDEYYESNGRSKKYKTEMCKYWQLRTCKRGSQCTFAHSANELRVQQEELKAEEEAAVTPKFSPQLAPKKYKTEMCKFWSQGRCKRSQGCTFAHYPEELREDFSRKPAFMDDVFTLAETTKYLAMGMATDDTPLGSLEASIQDLDLGRGRCDTGSSGATVEGVMIYSQGVLTTAADDLLATEESSETVIDDGFYVPSGLLD